MCFPDLIYVIIAVLHCSAEKFFLLIKVRKIQGFCHLSQLLEY